MNFFKRDDGILDVITKAITVVSFIFGIWIYFHTIHPVFQKESELQDLRKEKVNIQTDNERLSKETAKIKNDLHIQTEKIKDLNERAGNLSLEIESKNSELASINEKLEIAHNEAVLSKLNLIMDKILLLYTSDAADDQLCGNLRGLRISKTKIKIRRRRRHPLYTHKH